MKHIRHLIIQQKKNADGGSVETVSSAVITALYNMSKDEQLVYNSTDLKGDLHCAVGSAKQINSLMAQYPDLSIEADTYTIDFDDSEFERICLEKWGSNGSVTANQLAAVTNAGFDTFTGNTNIIKATDLIYFTGITGNNCPRFHACSNMTEITVPPNLYVLSNGFVSNCSSLTTVNGLDHVQSVQYGTFTGATSLTSLIFTSLTGMCEIGEMSTSALTDVQINEGCTSFRLILRSGGPTTFNVPSTVTEFNFTCPNLTTITFAPNSQCTSTRGYGGFSGCTHLTTINNFPWDTWTTMQSYCFANCESLTGTIKTPTAQTTIYPNTLAGLLAIDTVIVSSAVTTIEGGNFNRMKTGSKIIMNPTTPPALSHTVTGANYGTPNTAGCIFYVPDASYNDYISNGGQYWTELYNNGRIKKQSELPS